MITFLLSDSDIINAVKDSERQLDGFLSLCLPTELIQEQATKRVNLLFNKSAKTVHYGVLSARLSPLQFALLQYIYDNGRASFEDIQDHVWMRAVSDSAIRRAVSYVNEKLLSCGFACELLSRHSKVSIESVA